MAWWSDHTKEIWDAPWNPSRPYFINIYKDNNGIVWRIAHGIFRKKVLARASPAGHPGVRGGRTTGQGGLAIRRLQVEATSPRLPEGAGSFGLPGGQLSAPPGRSPVGWHGVPRCRAAHRDVADPVRPRSVQKAPMPWGAAHASAAPALAHGSHRRRARRRSHLPARRGLTRRAGVPSRRSPPRSSVR